MGKKKSAPEKKPVLKKPVPAMYQEPGNETSSPSRIEATIHPAELSTAVHFLAKAIDDLRSWAKHPDPKPLSAGWLAAVKDDLIEKTDAAIRSAEHVPNPALVEKIKRARKLGFAFATLLCDRPALSTVPIEQWTVPEFRQMFDDLHVLSAAFHQRAEPTPQAVASESTDNLPAGECAKLKKRTSKGASQFTDTQLEAVRGVIQKNSSMKMRDINSKLSKAGGTGISNTTLQAILDHIRKTFPGEYTVPVRSRNRTQS